MDSVWVGVLVASCLAVYLAGCAKALDGEEWRDPATIPNDIVDDDGEPPGDGDGDVVPQPSCDAPETVFKADGSVGGCNGPICHSAMTVYPPDLVSEGVAARLLDVASTTTICAGQKYIDSSNIESSLILSKLSAAPSCGIQMPFAQPPIPADKLECIRSWITSFGTPAPTAPNPTVEPQVLYR